MKLTKDVLKQSIQEELRETVLDLEPERLSHSDVNLEKLVQVHLSSLKNSLEQMWNDLDSAVDVANSIGAKGIPIDDKDVEKLVRTSIESASAKVNFSSYDEHIMIDAFTKLFLARIESGSMEFE